MSFLGLGGGAPKLSSEQKVQAAEAELDMVTDMFNRLVDTCYTKCIEKSKGYSEGDVNKNEGLCIDRCVAKYFDTNVKVGEHMQKIGSSQFPGRR
ncbi:protein transporter [Saccharomycopsis crataegensis]|uniref:Mitochondrial import inner membrane translocase subunit n=1 Tax=Saccharomycopsis crataegensis TaxID=43959 RepID=A0AAV5QMP7_9ASCO|nr:protein transporter [Saccharomycopsis crataegensis]